MRRQPLLHHRHRREIVFRHRPVMDAGVGQRGVDTLVPQQRLNRGDAAAGVDQLGGVNVPQLVRRHLHPGPLPRRLDTAAHL